MLQHVLDQIDGVWVFRCIGELHPVNTTHDLLVGLHRIGGLEWSVPGDQFVNQNTEGPPYYIELSYIITLPVNPLSHAALLDHFRCKIVGGSAGSVCFSDDDLGEII